MKGILQCGAAIKSITPSLNSQPINIAGFNTFDSEKITGIEHDIYLKCIVLEHNHSNRILFISYELIGMAYDLLERIRETLDPYVEYQNIFLYCTHTHAGPDTVGLWGSEMGMNGRQKQYEDSLVESTLAAVKEAKNNVEPAKILYSHDVCLDELVNFRPVKELTGDLHILQFVHAENPSSVIASFLTYTAQPEITGRRNTKISGDYPGIVSSDLEKITKSPVLFAMGLSGAMTPVCAESNFDNLHQFSNRLSLRIRAMLCNRSAIPFDHIEIKKCEFPIEVENKLYRQLISAGMFHRKIINHQVYTEVSHIRIGALHIFNLPGEVFPRLVNSLNISKEDIILFITLCNDNIGYLIPEDEFDIENPVWLENGSFVGHEQESLGKNAGKCVIHAIKSII